ncbi:unnamed protein product [Polarella glacialis]|uniref:Uncharacterized protein n=1 Tax=Polarella glacialis TaxID=89957 RepID=A0A813KZG1_POLGL|nr:unnamed protein product [Polarella glacialis]
MRALEVARALRPGADPSHAAAKFLEGLATCAAGALGGSGGARRMGEAALPAMGFSLDDAAALTQRFARHQPQPPPAFFSQVAAHIEGAVREASATQHLAQTAWTAGFQAPRSCDGAETAAAGAAITGTAAVVFADAFARSRCHEAISALGLLCLSTSPTASLSAGDVLRFGRSCFLLSQALGEPALQEPAVRAFLLMRTKQAVWQMEACDLAELSQLLASAGIYSSDLSDAIELQLRGNPWAFSPPDLQRLLPHFRTWGLGKTQKKAFQSLGSRFAEHAELLSPPQALEVIETFADVGSVHEVLLQHMYLALLLERSFVELPSTGIARLAASMSKVQHYHTGLLREIVAHLAEEPGLLADWGPEHLSGTLRSLGLAPVRVPSATQRMLGCRYAALLPELGSAGLKELFEVSGWHPDLLSTVVAKGSGGTLQSSLAALLASATPGWGPRACADAALALALAADMPLGGASTSGQSSASGGGGCAGCACFAPRPSHREAALRSRRRAEFRTEQPEEQLQVIMRAARNFRQGKVKQTAAHPELPMTNANHIWMPEEAPPQQLLPGGRCQAAWAAIAPPAGRRSRRLSTGSEVLEPAVLLAQVIPNLVDRLRSGSRALAELPGMPLPATLLLPEGEQPPPELLDDELPAQLPWPQDGVDMQLSVLQPDMLDSIDKQVASMAAAGELQAEEHRWWEASAEGGVDVEGPGDLETMRRSELLEVCVQTLAVLQLCLSSDSNSRLRASLPLGTLRGMATLLPMVTHLLRPRRLEDQGCQKAPPCNK